ncbi:MAG TPA: FmdB family zinc ribbon protein [Chloroflexia bacterium]|nr:FmdB family zinc ribbon protein [Chloroflexia bacterium]
MPTYEYQCGTCGNRFEKFQSFSEEPVKTCPECGNAVKKVFSPAGIIFKGSGWYINDSKKTTTSSNPAPTNSSKSESGSSSSESDSKSESKATSTDSSSGESKKSEAAA